MKWQRASAAIGSGIGGLPLIERTHEELASTVALAGFRRFRARVHHQHDFRHVSQVSLKGPIIAVVTACTTVCTPLACLPFAHSVWRSDGRDGLPAAQKPPSPLALAEPAAARALSTRNDNPKTACALGQGP
jgi:3-oxoacyl-[acyl-carrier-protein] synthase II